MAVQWDAAVDVVMVELVPDTFDTVAGRLAGHLDHVPDDIPTGLHLCYGNARHQHMIESESLATQVRLTNAIAERARRSPR